MKKSIISKFADNITSSADLLGSAKPSGLFYPLASLLRGLICGKGARMLSGTSKALRRMIHPIIMPLLPAFMDYKQVFENKNALLGIEAPDKPLVLPKESVIWCSNHGFKDDIAASIHTARHSYMYFGSLPHFYNTLDGLALFLNGVILCNRKIRRLKQESFELALQSLRHGNDLTIMPEGVWNKTPEKLMLDLWPGIYRMAKETGSKVIPLIHYLPDPHEQYDGNVIHTIIADPISMEGRSEKEGLELLRDTMATWHFLLMEKYGQTTRAELLNGFETADEAWDSYMSTHTGYQKYYDLEIELCADYRPKNIFRPETVWQPIADIRNIHAGNIGHVHFARQLVAREKHRDFQRRY